MTMVFSNLETDRVHEIVVGSIEIEFTTPDGKPCAGLAYELKTADGQSRKGTLTSAGRLVEKNLKPGTVASVTLPGIPLLAKVE